MKINLSELKSKKLYLLDMDGTIYIDNNLFEGTLDFLSYIKNIGGKYMFLTNNSSKSVTKYIEKLSFLGINADKEDFLTSADATSFFLHKQNYKKIYVFGTTSLKEQLKSEGHNICEKIEEGIDCLCMGFDTELTFKKLEDACILLQNKDIDYIATNPDYVCPTSFGFVPDCGSVSDMLFNATGRRPKFIGKPEPEMINMAIKKSGFKKEEAIIFGDRLYTDVASGKNAGITSVFVLSGEGTMETLKTSDVKPDYIFQSIKEYYDTLKKS